MLHGFCPSLGSHQSSTSVIVLYRCVWLLCSNLGTTDIIETSKQPRHHPWGIQGLCKNAVTAKSYIRCVLKRSAIAFMTRFSFDLEKRFSKCFPWLVLIRHWLKRIYKKICFYVADTERERQIAPESTYSQSVLEPIMFIFPLLRMYVLTEVVFFQQQQKNIYIFLPMLI